MNHPRRGSADPTLATAEGFLDDREATRPTGQLIAGPAVWPHGGTDAPGSAPVQGGDTGHV
ncbi:hypothetical protein JOF41_002233 [Saccharothrix coeruleofusca]|nr:hypothetical protein [Saccharothrix coeruleofusca]